MNTARRSPLPGMTRRGGATTRCLIADDLIEQARADVVARLRQIQVLLAEGPQETPDSVDVSMMILSTNLGQDRELSKLIHSYESRSGRPAYRLQDYTRFR